MTPWGAEEEFDVQTLFGRTVLQIAPALDAGPVAAACVEVAAALAEAGGRALVAGAPGKMVSELQARGGVFLPLEPARTPWAAALKPRKLAALAIREGVELIHVHGASALKSALYAARQARAPLVADYENDHDELALAADSVMVFSRQALEEMTEARPDVAPRLRRGLHGVDLRAYALDSLDPARVHRLRESLGVQPHVRLVIGLGLTPERQKLFLAAASQLKPRGFFDSAAQEARFVWLREASDPADLFESEAARLGLKDQVAQLAWSDRAAAYFAAALAVLPARESRACAEAQAAGAPVALLQEEGGPGGVEFICAPPEVEAQERTGWLAPPGAASTLARAAEEATRLGATARENLGRRARAHARNFSTERMCALTLAVYARHFAGREE